MTAQNGKDLLIKIDIDGAGQYKTIAGLRASRIVFNAQQVDITNLDSAGGWQELLGGAGVKSAALSGSGVFKDSQTDARMRAVFFDGGIVDYQIVIPDFGIISGPFQISSLEYAGNFNAEATYELAFVSAGALSFTAD